jgi:hypothetical protein
MSAGKRKKVQFEKIPKKCIQIREKRNAMEKRF